MKEIILWLQSPSGEEWSHQRMGPESGNPVRHSRGIIAALKYDHEGCSYDPVTGMFRNCHPATDNYSGTDAQILAEMKKFGMNGLP